MTLLIALLLALPNSNDYQGRILVTQSGSAVLPFKYFYDKPPTCVIRSNFSWFYYGRHGVISVVPDSTMILFNGVRAGDIIDYVCYES